LALFFQIVSDFDIRISCFRPKAGELALFFQNTPADGIVNIKHSISKLHIKVENEVM